jgi:hypothetical protein
MAGEGWEEIASGIDDWLQRTLEKVPAGAATET